VPTAGSRPGRPTPVTLWEPVVTRPDPESEQEREASGTTWCVTVIDEHGHAIGHGCARPEPRSRTRQREKLQNPRARDGPGFAFTADEDHGPSGGYGTWRLRTPGTGPDLIVTLDPVGTDPCDHWYQAKGHDPGIKLRHLSQVRHATCTSPTCRRPAGTCDFEHNIAYEAGGRTCLCNGGPICMSY